MLFEQRYRLRHLTDPLTYGDIDADEVAALLIDDAVKCDCRLAGGAVADDKLALPAANGNHGVDSLDACLHRGVHRTTDCHVRSDHFDSARLARAKRPLAIDGLAQPVHDAPDKLVTHGHDHDAAGASDL